MTLHREPTFPAARAFVLKLHRDASTDAIVGRLEGVLTGERFEFRSGEELLACIARFLGNSLPASGEASS